LNYTRSGDVSKSFGLIGQ